MNISTGISEINLGRTGQNSPVSGKNYIWPKYHDGKVDPIKKRDPHEDQLIYFKPSKSEKEKLLGMINNTEPGYNSYGKTEHTRPFIKPGSFFDALA